MAYCSTSPPSPRMERCLTEIREFPPLGASEENRIEAEEKSPGGIIIPDTAGGAKGGDKVPRSSCKTNPSFCSANRRRRS